LNSIGRHVETVDEGPDDGGVALGEGGVDVGIGHGTVARAERLDVVCIEALLPTLM
jgi:hypothetical protein